MGDDTIEFVRSTAGRHGSVEDIAPVVALLASDDARWVNGQDIQVDARVIAAWVPVRTPSDLVHSPTISGEPMTNTEAPARPCSHGRHLQPLLLGEEFRRT